MKELKDKIESKAKEISYGYNGNVAIAVSYASALSMAEWLITALTPSKSAEERCNRPCSPGDMDINKNCKCDRDNLNKIISKCEQELGRYLSSPDYAVVHRAMQSYASHLSGGEVVEWDEAKIRDTVDAARKKIKDEIGYSADTGDMGYMLRYLIENYSLTRKSK